MEMGKAASSSRYYAFSISSLLSTALESNLGTTDGLRVSQFFKLLRHNTGNQLYVP